jgi:hypothetical protein
VKRQLLEAIGGKLWTGDKSRIAGRNVQDVKITGIPLDNAKLAMRLVGASPRKLLSEAQKATLAAYSFR